MPIPQHIKVPTATQLLIDHLGIPQTPCPLVHPLAILVPNPTNNPAIPNPTKSNPPINAIGGSKIVEEKKIPGSKANINIAAAAIIPHTKLPFQNIELLSKVIKE